MGGNQTSQEPQPGDMIEFQRAGYTHWAIYVGAGQVVHFTLPDWIETIHQGVNDGNLTATVQRESLEEVTGNLPPQVNNEFDNELHPLPSQDIVTRANRMVGMELRYDLLRANCEHFASMMRYDVPRSQQVQNFQQVLPMPAVDPDFVSAIRERLERRTLSRYSLPQQRPRTVRCYIPPRRDEL